MRILILGAGGTLARELRSQKPNEHDVIARAHAELDVREPTALESAIRDAQADWVVNGSAYTDVDGAERNRDVAFAVNADAMGELARLCREANCGLAHFSTDFVFAGNRPDFYRESDEVAPVNTYGASKLAGEELIRQSGVRHLIIRTQWLYGHGGGSFLSMLWKRAQSRLPTRVVADQFGCCTYAVDLARVTWDALDRLEGTYHVANRGLVTRFDIARRIFEFAGAPDLVSPCESADFPTLARRPTHSALNVSKAERALGYRLPEWTDALGRFLAVVSDGEFGAVRAH